MYESEVDKSTKSKQFWNTRSGRCGLGNVATLHKKKELK